MDNEDAAEPESAQESNNVNVILDTVPGAVASVNPVIVTIEQRVQRTQKLVILSVVLSGTSVGLQVLTHFKLF